MISASEFLKYCQIFGVNTGGTPPPAGALLAVNNLSDVQSISSSRTNLGLGSAATQNINFFLQTANNLNDLQSLSQSVINLGLQNGYVDFNSNGNQTLTAPLPRKIGIGMTAGTNTIQLPNATTLNSNTLGDRFYIQNYGSVAVTFLDGTGASLQIIQPGTSWEYSPESNSTIAGSWIFTSNVAQIYTQFGVSNATYYPLFVPSNAGNTNQTPLLNTFFTYNPSSGILNTPQLIIGEPFTPISCNIKSFVSGSDSSGTDAPALGFFTNSDSYPLLQILPFTHGVSLLNFDCYSYNGAYYSSYLGSNFQIAKINNQLQFNFRSGISPGSTFAFQPLGYFDSFGNFTLNGKFIMGNPSGSTNALAQFNSNQYGILPPIWTSTQESTNTAAFGSADAGMFWYNSTIHVPTYWDGLDKQQILAIDNIIQGANMTITNNSDGTVTFASTGSGSTTIQVQGSFTVTKSTTFATPSTSLYTAVAIDGSKFAPINQVGTSVTAATINSVTTPIIQNTSAGGTRYCKINYDLGIGPSTASGQTYTFCIAIQRNGGGVVLTNFTNTITIPSISTAAGFKPISISGLVDLNTNDYAYLTVLSDTATQPLSTYYFNAELIDTTVANLPSTNSLTQGTNNLYLSQNGGSTYGYLSGSAIVGDIPQFSSTGGQLIDSGIQSANLIQTTTSLGGSLSGNLPNPSLSSTGISQIIAITQVSGSTQAMTDSAPINRYILQNSSPCTLTLPVSINAGHSFEIIGGRTAGWIIAQNIGQSIALGINITTPGTGGSLSSTNSTDSLILSCTTTNTQLTAYGVQGNITYV